MLHDLLAWLSEAEGILIAEQSVGNDPAKIKAQIGKHKVRKTCLCGNNPNNFDFKPIWVFCHCLMISKDSKSIVVKHIHLTSANLKKGVCRGSVVKCLTCNPGVLGSSHTGSFAFFVGVIQGKTLQSRSLVLVKPGKT